MTQKISHLWEWNKKHLQLGWVGCQTVFLFLLLLSFIYLYIFFSIFLSVALLPDFTIGMVLQTGSKSWTKIFSFLCTFKLLHTIYQDSEQGHCLKNKVVWPLTSSSYLRFYDISSLNNIEVAKCILYRQMKSLYFQILGSKLGLLNVLYRMTLSPCLKSIPDIFLLGLAPKTGVSQETRE